MIVYRILYHSYRFREGVTVRSSVPFRTDFPDPVLYDVESGPIEPWGMSLESLRQRGEGSTFDHGWIVVAAAFWVIAVTSGSFYSYGVFFKPMLAEFGWNRQLGSGVMGVACLIYVLILPFVGHLADRRGPRWVMAVSAGLLGLGYVLGSGIRSALQLYLFVGVLGGLSYPGLLPVPVAVVSRWFDRNRGLALGIALAGVGVGTLAMPALLALLVSAYGWRTAFAVLGFAVCLSCVPPCLMAMRDPEGNGASPPAAGPPEILGAGSQAENGPGLSMREAIRTRVFWILFAQYGICIAVLGMMMIHIVPHLTDRGMSSTTAANVLGAIGLGSVFGRILAGILADKYGVIRILAACLIAKVIVLFFFPRASGFAVAYVLGVCYGVSYGGFMVVIPALTSLLFGLQAMGAIFATVSVAEGIGFGVGSYLAGYIWDVTGSYQRMFQIAVVLIFVAMVLPLFIRVPKKNS
jgi:MFS family permease